MEKEKEKKEKGCLKLIKNFFVDIKLAWLKAKAMIID